MPSGISISGAASVNAVGKKLVKRGAALALKNAIAMEQTTLRLERDLKQKFPAYLAYLAKCPLLVAILLLKENTASKAIIILNKVYCRAIKKREPYL